MALTLRKKDNIKLTAAAAYTCVNLSGGISRASTREEIPRAVHFLPGSNDYFKCLLLESRRQGGEKTPTCSRNDLLNLTQRLIR